MSGEHLTQDGGQELIVGDVLYLGPHHLPGLLIQCLLVPVRVDGLQEGGQPVVLPDQQGVETGQPGIVIDSLVTRPQTLASLAASLQSAVGVVVVLRQQVAAVHLQHNIVSIATGQQHTPAHIATCCKYADCRQPVVGPN